MKVLIQALAIGLGGFVGALSRWAVALAFGSLLPTRFPVGTFFINISGSFFLGWFLTFATFRYPVSDTLRLAVATGFVGAYTTFSTYMYESAVLSDEKAWIATTLNLLGSLVVGMAAVKFGMILGRRA